MRLMYCAMAVLIASSAAAWAADKNEVEQKGRASYYSSKLQGHKTASGARMQQNSMTAASPTLPLGAKAKVTNAQTGKSADVTVNDRGPNTQDKGRVIDVSKQAADKLGMKQQGVAPVKVEAKPEDQPTPELKQKVEQAAKH